MKITDDKTLKSYFKLKTALVAKNVKVVKDNLFGAKVQKHSKVVHQYFCYKNFNAFNDSDVKSTHLFSKHLKSFYHFKIK